MPAKQVLADPRRTVGEYKYVLVGALVWATALLLLLPSPFDTVWANALLMLAPLVLVPLGLRLVARDAAMEGLDRLWQTVTVLELPAALLLGWAFLLPQGLLAAGLSTFWLATTGFVAILGLARVWRHFQGPLYELCVDAGLLYVVVGSFWAVLDRWGVRPLNFDAVIVLLTAIHFHYAGFLLPVLTGLAMRRVEGHAPRMAGISVVAAVPLVAMGITATQLRLGPLLECLSAWLMATAGIQTGWLYFRLARQAVWPPIVRGLWVVSAVSLAAGMVLAAVYGSRFYLPITWLDIHWMRVLHGTANAFGFGLAGLAGWALTNYPPGTKLGGCLADGFNIKPANRGR